MKTLNVHFAVMVAGNGIYVADGDSLDAHIDDRELKVSPSIATISRGTMSAHDQLEGDRAGLMVLLAGLKVAAERVQERLQQLGVDGGEQIQSVDIGGPGGAKA